MKRLFLFLLVALAVAPLARNQNVDTGLITGEVHDISGGLITAVPVILKNTATGLESQTATDSHGLFVSPPLPPGAYDVEV